MRASSTTLITPRLQILAEDQKETLFLSVLEVLERTGVQVDNCYGTDESFPATVALGNGRSCCLFTPVAGPVSLS